ncbi:unnamed protein product [Danaus chrysippus]|uniref:(African queen) hypothetical protein n=1 Tax=Danaus chrysippus TaxID=151541 RepID=A0A8J2QF20_9NEOP|nr:unnamed protein product [Danaus chrysippus]
MTFKTTKTIPEKRTTQNVDNMTLEKFIIRRRRIQLQELLEDNINAKPNFGDKEDEITIQTRRFNAIVNSTREEPEALRELYFDDVEKRVSIREKKKTIALMEQFVYETHYMLPFMQVIRNKYKHHPKYQLGYCFSLLRTLKAQQMKLWTNLKTYQDIYLEFYTFLKIYEKVVRLDIDIKDILRIMYKLDVSLKKKKRKRKYRPEENGR